MLAVSMLGRPCLALDKRADPLTHATVIHLRLDYLPNALMFMPLAPLWRLGFPRHPLRRIIPAGLAVGLEGVRYLPPYRAWKQGTEDRGDFIDGNVGWIRVDRLPKGWKGGVQPRLSRTTWVVSAVKRHETCGRI